MLPAMSLGDYVDTYTSEVKRGNKLGAGFRASTINELTVFLAATIATYMVVRYMTDDEAERKAVMSEIYNILGKVFIEYMVLTIIEGVYRAANE